MLTLLVLVLLLCSYKASQLIHAGPNVERFLVGRQFLLLFCGFLVSRVGGAGPNAPVDNFYIGDWVWNPVATSFFWANSVLLMIVIIVPGQLVSQLLAADKMLGFFNLGWVAALYTVCYPCLFIESLGLTHSSYVLKDVLAWAQGIDTSTADPKKAMTKAATPAKIMKERRALRLCALNAPANFKAMMWWIV